MAEAIKPVKLQLNCTGAWRDVIRWDAADDAASDQVVAAAETLGRIGRASCRIAVADEGGRSPTVLTHWSLDHGWQTWR